MSEPVRPEPAVGQVWRDEDGRLYVLANGIDNLVSIWYEDLGAVFNIPKSVAVQETDTYIGQYDGFKVK